MNKNVIQKYAIWARNELIEQVKQRAYQYGISEKGDGDENATVISGRVLSNEEKQQRRSFVNEIKKSGYKQAVEEVAYTWFNRFVALRYMEVNDYLPTHVRVFSDTSGNFKPEIHTNVLHLDLPGLDKAKVSALLNTNATEELYRYLLLTQCNALNELLPEMFERMGAYTEMLLPNNILKPESVIGRLVKDIPEEDFRDAVQIIGWLYQYYNTEPKQAVFDGLKKNVKITKENIPAATQLFTPDWIVRYMVENSLGRIFIGSRIQGLGISLTETERIAKEKEIADSFGWKYYIPETEQTPEVRAQLLPTPYFQIPIEDLKILDPCMGSGHILVYAFDVLMQIYTSEGYSERDAAKLILEKNIYGLEIDRRAYQLAYFALMMKARQYNRRILTLGVSPQMYEPTGYADGMEYGSLVSVDKLEPMPEPPKEQQLTLFDSSYDTKLNAWNFRRLLAQKYDVVVTNPPYMGSKGMSAKLSEYMQHHFPDSKSDLFSAFIKHCAFLTKTSGYTSMITMESWMFLSSFEKLREDLLSSETIANLVHMPYLGKGGTSLGINFGTSMFVRQKQHISKYQGQYMCIRYYETDDNGVPFKFPTINERYKSTSTDSFAKIPGSPVAYWVGDNLLRVFNNTTLETHGSAKAGIQTGNNDLFLKYWFEVSLINIAFGMKSIDQYQKTNKRWVPQIKGGAFRKWYGNFDYVINMLNNGEDIAGYAQIGTVRLREPKDYFIKGITWSHTTSGGFGARLLPAGFLRNVEAPTFIAQKDENNLYLIALLNSPVSQLLLSLFNSTFHYLLGDVLKVPVIFGKGLQSKITETVNTNISLSRTDWDAFETSWDFKRHQLVCGEQTAAAAFAKWEHEAAERFDTLKANEEELNRIFIEIYGLSNELTPEVDDKDVTVRRADLSREIRSLISYAVGCMFGRYSLDCEGLAYAGGKWDAGMYKTFPADKDNILPICDDEYFDGDISGRFVDFVKTVYGADTLEENLKFIADALGGKGTPREVIRNYFLNDFYKDHCKIYQKRPIYWLFDSGKKNGFKALIYMHRYSQDLLAMLRTDYVHEQQERYRTQISHIAGALNTAAGAQRARLLKQQDKLSEQEREIGAYEEKVHHLADMNITIDLDDGVKKNYEIFADILAKLG